MKQWTCSNTDANGKFHHPAPYTCERVRQTRRRWKHRIRDV